MPSDQAASKVGPSGCDLFTSGYPCSLITLLEFPGSFGTGEGVSIRDVCMCMCQCGSIKNVKDAGNYTQSI